MSFIKRLRFKTTTTMNTKTPPPTARSELFHEHLSFAFGKSMLDPEEAIPSGTPWLLVRQLISHILPPAPPVRSIK
ncbi:MAG: hypothetical protein QXT73_02710 [Candidatus Methanomethylicaceae archaeon]